jgi:hypothetical protein
MGERLTSAIVGGEGQLHSPAALLPGKKPPLPIGQYNELRNAYMYLVGKPGRRGPFLRQTSR